jgi:pyruvate,orthophosphate dikinase
MALGVGDGECGAGFGQMLLPTTGEEIAFGRYVRQGQGLDAADAGADALFLGRDDRGPSLETETPKAFAQFTDAAAKARRVFRDDVRLDFTIQDEKLWILDARPAERSGRASIAASVRMAEDGIKSRSEALLSLDPRNLNEVLHPQIDPKAERDVFARGIAASPGAATGRIVFSANAAQAAAARGDACILVRVETTPEDIRGMHSALGILTERGGANSHAAVVARGLGLPCVVGASDISIDRREKALILGDGRVMSENDVITLDGAAGEAMIGAPKLVEPDMSGAFNTFMSWADDVRTLDVRANADTPSDARMARGFGVDGIGLCRTEHMFFDEGRLAVMRNLIFAEDEAARLDALNLLMPMQQGDFEELFEIMEGFPVCIRLLDPPLHEFLPRSREEISQVASEMDLPISTVNSRIEELSEFNPMLGMRGVRLGINFPEIYEMQARAIFEACASVQSRTGAVIQPEIMVPLVSANREVEMVKARVETIAASVRSTTGQTLDYQLGVMVETPRAALRAGDIAQSSEFFSFGTNDLTQMTYGLSRDDAGRFMREYVSNDVFPEDPFHTLDTEGVGELILLAVDRGRAVKADLKIGLCGEHGGDPISVAFCYSANFDYVSCSPFRTPIARLAAAQAAILDDSRSNNL